MLLTPHTMVGTAVAILLPNPLLAWPISFALHFVFDKVPHWDFYSNTTVEERIKGWRPLAVMADLGIGIFVGTFFTLYALWVLQDTMLAVTIFGAGVASVLPDALTGPVFYLKRVPKVLHLLKRVQSACQWQAPLPWGILTQVLTIGVAGWIAYTNLF